MPDPQQQPDAEPEHPLHEMLADIQKRMRLLGEAKGFTAEHAKHEFRDDVYPVLYDLAQLVGELDDRVAMLEAEEANGIDADLAEGLIEGFTRFGACLDILAKHVPSDSGDGKMLAEHLEWYKANVPDLIDDVKAAVEPDDGQPDEQPEREAQT